MTIKNENPTFKKPRRRNRRNRQSRNSQAHLAVQRHARSRKSPAPPSVQAQPASDTQSGCAETTPSALFNSALISGGQFTSATNANHRNVTINIHATEGVTPQPQTHNEHSLQTANRRRKKRGRRRLMPDPLGPVQRSNEIYERHLRLKNRGHPLWIPQSNMNLPIPYRAQGVRLGDVGVFKNGGFDFLFNICVPRDDPINPRKLPPKFIPISPPIDPKDIRKFAEFSPGSYLASSSVAESPTAESSGLIFESSASEGAILTMPEGAYSEDLSNLSRLRQYIRIHAEALYKFVNGPRGREAQNGDLHVVVGCDKTTSWGMATFADSSSSQETNFRLKFSALGEQQSQLNAGNKYMWEHSGVAEVRVGPGPGENEELGETDSNRLRNQSLFLRTLTVTLSEKVWEEVFPHLVAVADQDPYSGIQDYPQCRPHVVHSGHSHPESSQSNSSQNLPSQSHNSTISPISSNIVPSNPMSLHEDMEDSGPSTDCVTDIFSPDVLESNSKMKCVAASQLPPKEGTSSQISSNASSPTLGRYDSYEGTQYDSTSTPNVILTHSSSGNILLHPSKIINQYLLKHVPQARVAVTHDKDWSTIIDMFPCHSDLSELFTEVCSRNDIVLDNDTGLVYLELKENLKNEIGVSSEKVELIESIKDGRLKLDQYLFGFHDDHCLRLEDLCNMLRSGSTNQPIPMDSFLKTHPERPLSLDELLNNFEGDQGSIRLDRQSIINLRAKLSLLPTRHADRSSSLLRLGDALLRRFSQCAEKDDLEEGIWCYKEALSLLPNSHYHYLEALLGLCSSLYQRYYRLGHADDLENLLLNLDLQCDTLKRQPSLLAPVEVRLGSPSALDTVRTANPRGRALYNPACDVCARKKIKCNGIKPICQPCQTMGRQKECTWVRNTVREPRTEAYIEDMHKRESDIWRYTNYLESLLDECSQHQHPNFDFRAARPPDPEVLLGQEDDSDVDNYDQGKDDGDDFDALKGGDDNDQGCDDVDDSDIKEGGDDNSQGSDDGNDPTLMAISIPPQSLQVEPFTRPSPSRFPAIAENPDDTYVLFVDSVEPVQPSRYKPTLDWSRHLPSNVPLDRSAHDTALDLLFKFFTSWCLRIVPAFFLRDMYRALRIPPSQTPPKTPHYSPMLHNALVALALAFLDEPFNHFKIREIYANAAKSFIESECRKPNLSVVHALSVLSSFHCSQGDQTLGYMYFGMSVRMGQALGLNLDFSEWAKLGIMNDADRLDYHWASWTNFAEDVCLSLYVGRDFCVAEPIGIAEPRCIAEPIGAAGPICIAEPIGVKATPILHIDLKYDEMTWFHPPAQIPPQPNNLTKTFEATCRLLMIARGIMDVNNGLNKSCRDLDKSIDDIEYAFLPTVASVVNLRASARLNTWRDSLSEELEITTPRSRLTATPHKLMLHLAYWWLVILLHRPFFLRKSRPIHGADSQIDHVKICRQAAEQIMELLCTWRTHYKLRYCPVTLIQTAFSAGTVYLLIAIQATSGTQKELRHSLDQETLVQQYLQEIGSSWNCATIISFNLRNIMNEQVKPHLELMNRKNIPTSPCLHISADIGDDDEENNSSRSRSSSRIRSSVNNSAP